MCTEGKGRLEERKIWKISEETDWRDVRQRQEEDWREET